MQGNLKQGQVIGERYHIISFLGQGGFGHTYLAEDRKLPGNPHCVVKHLQPQNTEPRALQEARRWFNQEAEILYKLGRDNPLLQVPKLLAHFEENQQFYLVQEFIDGHNLSQELPPGKKLSEDEVINLLQEILTVLQPIHAQNIIHRDIKPDNIRRRQDGKIFLIDFGAVKQMQQPNVNGGQGVSGVVITSPGYTPPEQCSYNPQLSSDVYAVGMIGIQALTGINPDPNNGGGFAKDANGEISWRHLAPNVSGNLAAVLDQMVLYNYPQRYDSAATALAAVASLKSTVAPTQVSLPPTIPITPPASSQSNITSTPPNKTWFNALIGAGVGLAVVAVGIKQIQPCSGGFFDSCLLEVYENQDVGVKLKYPRSWEKRNISDPITGGVVQFLSPMEGDGDFQESVALNVENLAQAMTLDDYTKSVVVEVSNFGDRAEILQNQEITFAGNRGKVLVYQVNDETNKKRKYRQVFTLKAYRAYVLTYEAEAGKYDKFFGSVEQMEKSLEVD